MPDFKDEIKARFCAVATQVAHEVYEHQVASDCFCSHDAPASNFQFDEVVVEFIEQAVRDAISKHKEVL